ncbi:MAG: type II toxin-antitoxin system VapC family toxin [Phycisphaerae bacterium]
MRVLADTNVLLRLFDRADPDHAAIRNALRSLDNNGDEVVVAPQSVSELWNVCTRPISARGGMGLSVRETDRRVRLIERSFTMLPDSMDVYKTWRRLVVDYKIEGVNVHDARLVAFMIAHQVPRLLTLNIRDFKRYSEITAYTP